MTAQTRRRIATRVLGNRLYSRTDSCGARLGLRRPRSGRIFSGLLDPRVDQVRPRLGERLAQRGQSPRRRRGAGTPMPCAIATKSRSGPPRSSSSAPAGRVAAAPTRESSKLEDRVGAVVADDRGDVGLLAGLGPQRLDRVHRAAVGLEADHRPVGAGDRRAGGHGQPVADRAAGQREPVVRGAGRRSPVSPTPGGERLVDDDRALGQQRPDDGRRAPRGSARRVGSSGAPRPCDAALGAPAPSARPAPRSAATPSSRGPASTCTVQSSGQRGGSAGRGRRRRPPAPGCRPATRWSARRAPRWPSRAGRAAAAASGNARARARSAARERVVGISARAGAGGDPGRGAQRRGRAWRRRRAAARSARPSAAPWRRPRAPSGAAAAGVGPAAAAAGPAPSSQRRRRPGGSASRSRRRGRAAAATASAASRRDAAGDSVRAHPAARRAGDRVDVGLQRRVEPLVRARVVADDVDHRRARRRALCRLASPLPRPGPRCSSVAAGPPGHAGVADGYAPDGRTIPAATLLHLGPGLGNALANLHNALQGARRRWSTSSATTRRYHKPLDAPLASDIETIARHRVALGARRTRDARCRRDRRRRGRGRGRAATPAGSPR